MKLIINGASQQFATDTGKGTDISLPLDPSAPVARCYDAPALSFEPVITEHFIGDIAMGGSVNFKNIFLNPHGTGTHTECVGHITSGPYTIQNCLDEYLFQAALVSVTPVADESGDLVITRAMLEAAWDKNMACNPLYRPGMVSDLRALIVRTLPNAPEKKSRDYTGTNPPFFTADAIRWTCENGFMHLLTDLPSVDKESDGGALAAHKAFWGLPGQIESKKTITEMVYVDNNLEDNVYFCQIQVISLCLDVSPSKVILYPLEPI